MKITGIQVNTVFWIGSVGSGFIFICTNIVIPIRIGQTPMVRKAGTAKGSRPNRLKIDVGSGAARSWIQPKNGAWRISIETKSTL